MSRKIDLILSEISLHSRTALHLFYKEEKNYKEIAAIMKMPLNSVKSHLFRGKEEIRKRLSKDFSLNFGVN
jgi:RNA polymerase sigma-70 factor (ECF subfamily)